MPVVRTLRKLTAPSTSPSRKPRKETLNRKVPGPKEQQPNLNVVNLQCLNPKCPSSHLGPFTSPKGLKSHVNQNPDCFKAYIQAVNDVAKKSFSNTNEDIEEPEWEDMDEEGGLMDDVPLEWNGIPLDWEEDFCAQVDHDKHHDGEVHDDDPAALHDDTVDKSQVRTEYHSNGGTKHGKGKDIFHQIGGDENRRNNPYFPFSSKSEYQLGSWLSRLKVPMKEVDKFLRLEYVSSTIRCIRQKTGCT